MKITAITSHYDGPDVWGLCEKYMARQTRKPDQWLVLDSSRNRTEVREPCEYVHIPQCPEMPDKIMYAIDKNLFAGDIIAFIETDDWYAPDWLEWIEQQSARGFDLVGEGDAIYYNVRRRWWSECKNVRHASLCQTAMHIRMLEPMVNTIKAWDNPYFDCRLWRLEASRYLHLPRSGRRRCIGIKGTFEAGYSPEHRQRHPKDSHADPSLMKLWKLIGADAKSYAPFYLK